MKLIKHQKIKIKKRIEDGGRGAKDQPQIGIHRRKNPSKVPRHEINVSTKTLTREDETSKGKNP